MGSRMPILDWLAIVLRQELVRPLEPDDHPEPGMVGFVTGACVFGGVTGGATVDDGEGWSQSPPMHSGLSGTVGRSVVATTVLGGAEVGGGGGGGGRVVFTTVTHT